MHLPWYGDCYKFMLRPRVTSYMQEGESIAVQGFIKIMAWFILFLAGKGKEFPYDCCHNPFSVCG